MWLAKEAEKAGVLAMRLGAENIPVQPVHLVPPGKRDALCKCSGSGGCRVAAQSMLGVEL